jgi:hypothetical protein
MGGEVSAREKARARCQPGTASLALASVSHALGTQGERLSTLCGTHVGTPGHATYPHESRFPPEGGWTWDAWVGFQYQPVL